MRDLQDRPRNYRLCFRILRHGAERAALVPLVYSFPPVQRRGHARETNSKSSYSPRSPLGINVRPETVGSRISTTAKFLDVPSRFRVVWVTRHKFDFCRVSVEKHLVTLLNLYAGLVSQYHGVTFGADLLATGF
jgi:hypothetical protein